MQKNDLIVDVSVLVPRERHPRVFGVWNSLVDGQAMVLVNDHDPVPLYYQFAAEHRGAFRWEYLERGPERWQVRISKGVFADSGFVPGQSGTMALAASAVQSKEPLVLDVRPVFAQGGSPCTTIDDAIASLAPGQSFVLLVPFEPAPLFAKLGAKGFRHTSQLQPDGSCRIEFTPGGPVLAGVTADVGCGCAGH